MDEAHRYRATAATAAINELKPALGIELTATAQIERGTEKTVPFKNVIYHYPLATAIDDGFVKKPWVAGRKNFDASKYSEERLEKLKIEDGIRLHESTKLFLQKYAFENNVEALKPFVLIITRTRLMQIKSTL